LDGCTEYRWPLLFCPGSSFRSRLSRGDGTGNGPMLSLRPSSITEHHSVSSLDGPAREASSCSRYLRAARDVDATCTVGRDVHESMATKVRAHRAPNLLRGYVGRSDRSAGRPFDASVDPTDARHTLPLRTRGTFITALTLARYECHRGSGVRWDARVEYVRSLPARHLHQAGKECPVD